MPCKADAASVEWITDDDALAAAAGAWGRVIGLDTEFQRTDTFFPLPGLYQVSDGSRVYLHSSSGLVSIYYPSSFVYKSANCFF